MTHKEEIERVVEEIAKKMSKGSDSSRSIGTGTFLTSLDKKIIAEAFHTHTLQEASWWHQKHREYIESLTEGNRDAAIHIHQLMRERIDSMKKEVMNKTP